MLRLNNGNGAYTYYFGLYTVKPAKRKTCVQWSIVVWLFIMLSV